MEKEFKFRNYTNDQLRELRFFAPIQPNDVLLPMLGFALKSGNRWEGIPVECKICERRWKLDEGDSFWPYKIELEPVDPNLIPVFGREEYYGCDFESLVNQDAIHLKQAPTEHVEVVKWREPLTKTCYIEHEGYTIVA